MELDMGQKAAVSRLKHHEGAFLEAIGRSFDQDVLAHPDLDSRIPTKVPDVARHLAVLRGVVEEQVAMESEVRTSFRLLQKAGFGRLLLGRKGMETRFEWRGEILGSFLNLAVPDLVSAAVAAEQTQTEAQIHRFAVRPGLSIELKLPLDFTRTEAGRLARFVESLSFEGAVPRAE